MIPVAHTKFYYLYTICNGTKTIHCFAKHFLRMPIYLWPLPPKGVGFWQHTYYRLD